MLSSTKSCLFDHPKTQVLLPSSNAKKVCRNFPRVLKIWSFGLLDILTTQVIYHYHLIGIGLWYSGLLCLMVNIKPKQAGLIDLRLYY